MNLNQVKTDHTQRELSPHGTPEFPFQINHDNLYSYYEQYIRCHWHEELEIPVVVSGSVRCHVRNKNIILRENQGIFINSKVPHSFFPLSKEEPRMLTVIFHPSLLYGTLSNVVYARYVFPYTNDSNAAGILLSDQSVHIVKEMDQLYDSKSFGYELRIQSLLCSFFAEQLTSLQDTLQASPPVRKQTLSRMDNLLNALHMQYNQKLDLSELAHTLSLSKEGCCRLFKKMTGQTISQYLEDYRISQSLKLLRESPHNIMQISYMVGFSNPGRFSVAFKKRMDCTPKEYRQQISKGLF